MIVILGVQLSAGMSMSGQSQLKEGDDNIYSKSNKNDFRNCSAFKRHNAHWLV